MPAYRDPAVRFAEKHNLGSDGCWLWTAHLTPQGYGRFSSGDGSGSRRGGRMILAHRWSYVHHVGPIPEGMFLDHICRVRHCVNPDHLRLVTKKQNAENRVRQANNTSGFQGVSYSRTKGKWQAYICHGRKQIALGHYSTAKEAGAVALAARLELFSHNDGDRGTP